MTDSFETFPDDLAAKKHHSPVPEAPFYGFWFAVLAVSIVMGRLIYERKRKTA